MHKVSLALVAGLLPATALAQNPRTITLIDASVTAFDPVVESSGNLTIAAYSGSAAMSSPFDNTIFVRTSDGRGITWNPPIQIDSDPSIPPARKDLNNGFGDVHIDGNTAYIIWRDQRAGEEIYLSKSTDAGATWSGELLVTGAAFGSISKWRLAVTGSNVYILLNGDPGGSSGDELNLFVSTDSGATFGSAIYVPRGTTSGDGFDVDQIGLAASGQTVHVAWVDNRTGGGADEVFYQQSTDGGATWLTNDVQLDTPGDGSDAQEFDLHLSMRDSTVSVVWAEEPTGSGNEVLIANTSTNGGTSFGGPVTVGGYTAGTDDVDNPWAGITANGNIIAVWEDNRTGSDEIYAATSTNGGTSFGADAQVTPAGGGFPRLIVAGSDPVPVGCPSPSTMDCAAICWTSATFPNTVESSTTIDGGVTWQTAVTCSVGTTGDADFAEGTFNNLYQNFVIAYVSDDIAGTNNMFAGGFRPQTVDPVGFVAGPTSIGFNLSHFATDPFAVVLLSATPGSFLLPGDCRSIDVGIDAILVGTLGFFIAPLAGGAGSTPTLSVNLPAGLNFEFAAFSLGTSIGQLTDGASVGT